MLKRIAILIVLLLLIPLPVFARDDGWASSLQDAANVDKTAPTEDQSLVWDALLQVWIPEDIVTLEIGEADYLRQDGTTTGATTQSQTFTNGITLDNIYSTGGLKILPTATGVIALFGETDVTDAATDGKSVYLYRKAAEGDNAIQVYIDADRIAHFVMDSTTKFHTTGDDLLFYAETGTVRLQPYAHGPVDLFGLTDVANDADGQILYINRMAAEGDSNLQLYMEDDKHPYIISSTGEIYFNDDNIHTTGTLEAGLTTVTNLIDNGLTASLGVYSDASKQLTSTAPSGGVLGYWNRDSDNGYIFQNTIADNIGLGTITPQAVLDVVDDIQTDALELRNIAGLTKLYDYNNITNPSSFHKAYMKQSLTASDMLSNPVTGYGGTEFSTTNYGLIWAAAGGAQNLANGTAYYLSIMCEMEIGEVADDVSSFDVYITDFNNHNRATFYHALWNNRTSTWDNIGGPYTLNTNRSITHTISANISDYITADKTVYYLQYTTTATTLLNSFRLVYISLTPTLVQTIATLEDNVRDDDIIVERTSPTALDVRQSDGTQIFNVSTASGATSLTTLNLENLISTGQTWFKYPKMGFGIGYKYSFSSSGAPVDDTIIRFAYGHDDIDTATNGLNMEYFYAPVTETTGEHWSARIGHNPTGTEYGTGSLIGNVAFNIKTDYHDAPFGSSDLDIRNIRSTGISLLGTTTGKSLTNMELTPYSIGAGTLTITEPVINLHLKNATGSVAGTLEQLVIEKPTGGSVANYQVVLAGNGVGTGIWFDAERLYSDGTNLTSAAPILALDKIKFTQTDGNEYLDSLNTGYMDYGATTGHRFLTAPVSIANNTASTTGATGALIVTGGVGIGGRVCAANGASLGDGGSANYVDISGDGVVILQGDAKAWKSDDLPVQAVKIPAANYPANDDIDNFGFHRYDFEDEESVYYTWVVPIDYATGSANIRGHYSFVIENPPSGGGNLNVRMGFEYKRITEDAVFDFSAGTTSGYIDEVITDGETAYILHITGDGTLTTTNWVAHDKILFRFYRDSTAAEDTYDDNVGDANDVWIKNYHLEYLVNKFGEAS